MTREGDLISRQAVMNCIDGYSRMILRPLDLKEYIDKLPPVNLQEKTGHWIKREPYPMMRYDYECSECGSGNDNECDAFCRNCGAKMVEPQERSE